jgi:hypothetical protein
MIGATKKILKWTQTPIKPRNDHTCHQKLNPSRETVPFSIKKICPKLTILYFNFFVRNYNTHHRNVLHNFILKHLMLGGYCCLKGFGGGRSRGGRNIICMIYYWWILQALADIKPDVEATIKMGRRLVETKAVLDPPATSKNIDSLKELFNLLGSQVRLS